MCRLSGTPPEPTGTHMLIQVSHQVVRERRLADLVTRLELAEAPLQEAHGALGELRELVGLGMYRVAP